MSEIVEFIAARLAEDQELAGDAAQGRTGVWTYQDRHTHPAGPNIRVVDDLGCEITDAWDVNSGPWYTGPHIAHHNPARVLREVAAKRRVLGRHVPHRLGADYAWCEWCRPQVEVWPCPDLLDLAAVWADHPDYRQEWAP